MILLVVFLPLLTGLLCLMFHRGLRTMRLPPIFDHGSANLRWNLRFPVPCSGGQ
ncbi:hypothetical protein SCARR_05410 [Pontiella sulfatireligans]|uniref:Uncharacterized protein n=1 Tax=Pontiella sulfatireligans TaxID=2750658 RepID=A0A6C2UTL1_9BACT|nr:hypothetical protein SCARR_05410 [Pontiella sulfatireligans]